MIKLVNILSQKIEEQFTSIKEAFQFFDLNNDDKVSMEEFCLAIKRLKIKTINKEEAQIIFEFLDDDNDKNVSFNEFTKLE